MFKQLLQQHSSGESKNVHLQSCVLIIVTPTYGLLELKNILDLYNLYANHVIIVVFNFFEHKPLIHV